MTRRRLVLQVAMAGALPGAGAFAQPAVRAKPWRIGVLSPIARTAEMAGANPKFVSVAALLRGLGERGYEYGRHFTTEALGAAGRAELYEGMVAEVLKFEPDVIVSGGPLLRPLKRSGTRVPVVMGGAVDPVGYGLVNSLAQPGGNFTGLSNQIMDLRLKRLELLHQLLPEGKRVGVLWSKGEDRNFDIIQALARPQGWELVSLEATTPEDLPAVFARATKARVGAIFSDTSLALSHRARLAELALASRIVLNHALRDTVGTEAFIAYSADIVDIWYRCARYVVRILEGTKPGDLAVEQPTRFQLVLNAKNLAAIGIKVPPALLARADEVIQ